MSYDGQFLHSLSTDAESLDSYTCRISASVLTNKPLATGHINNNTQWLKQVLYTMCVFIVYAGFPTKHAK